MERLLGASDKNVYGAGQAGAGGATLILVQTISALMSTTTTAWGVADRIKKKRCRKKRAAKAMVAEEERYQKGGIFTARATYKHPRQTMFSGARPKEANFAS